MAVAPFGLGVLFYAKDKLSPAMARLQSNYDRFGRSLGYTDGQIKRIGSSIRGLNTEFSRFFITGTLAQMGLALGQSWIQGAKNIAATGTTLSRAYGDFEGIANRIKIASGATSEEMKKLEDNAYKVGIATMFSWSEAMEAQRLLISKGASMNLVLDGSNKSILNSVVYLSEMTGKQLSLADSTNLLIGMTNRFKLTSSEQVRTVANQLAMIQNMGAEAKDIRAYFQSMGTIPSQMGAGATELIAFLPLLKKFDISARQAGFSISSFYSDLFMVQKRGNLYNIRKDLAGKELKTPALVEMFKRLNISLFDDKGEALPALTVIGQFMDKMSGKSAREVQEVLGVLNKRGQNFLGMMLRVQQELKGKGVAFGMDAILETMKKLDPANKELQNILEKNSKIMRNSTKGIEDYYTSVMDSLKVIFGKSASEIRNKLLKGIAEPLEKIGLLLKDTNIPKYIISIGASVAVLAASFGGFMVATTSLALFLNSLSMIKSMVISLIPFMRVFAGLSTSIAVSNIAGGVTGATKITPAVASLINPMNNFIAGGLGLSTIKGMLSSPSKALSQDALLASMGASTASKVFKNNVNSSFVGKASGLALGTTAKGQMMSRLNTWLGMMSLQNIISGKGRSGWNMSNSITKATVATKSWVASLKSLNLMTVPVVGSLLSVLRVIGLFIARLTVVTAVILTLYSVWKTGMFGIKDAVVGAWNGIIRTVSIASAIMSGDMNIVSEKFKEIKKGGIDAYEGLGISLGKLGTQFKLFLAMWGSGSKERSHLTPKYDKIRELGSSSPFAKLWTDTMFGTFKALGVKTSIKEKGYAIPEGLARSFYEAGGTKEDLMGMARLLDSLTALKDSINQLVTTVFPNFTTDLKTNVEKIVGAMTSLTNNITLIVKPIQNIADFLKILVDTINLIPGLKTVADSNKSVTSTYKTVAWGIIGAMLKDPFKPMNYFSNFNKPKDTVNYSGDYLNDKYPPDPYVVDEKINKGVIQKSATKFSGGVNINDTSKQTVSINASGIMTQELLRWIQQSVNKTMNEAEKRKELARQQFNMGINIMNTGGTFLNTAGGR